MVRVASAVAVAGALLLVGGCGSDADDTANAVTSNNVVANAPTEVEAVPPDESSDDQATDNSDSSDEVTDDNQGDDDDSSSTDDSSDSSTDQNSD